MNLRNGLITELIKERRLHLQREDIVKGLDIAKAIIEDTPEPTAKIVKSQIECLRPLGIDRGYQSCSECGAVLRESWEMKYCYNCGLKLEGADAMDKKAYWKIYKRIDSDAHKTCKCSKCGYSAPVIIAKTPYCPMCGSEMENGNNETV